MADRREVLLAAVATALGVASVNWHSEVTTKPAGLNVYRHLGRQADQDSLPDVTVLYLGEDITPENQGPTDVSERDVRVAVRCRATAAVSESGDEGLIPTIQWAEIALLTDYTLGGVAANGKLLRIDQVDTAEHADVYAEAVMQFVFTLHTKWGDPRQTT